MDIVRDYDIRGIYPKEINEEIAYKIGKKLGDFSKKDKLYLNYDNRLGSLRIRDQIEKGINEKGIDVIEGPLGPLAAISLKSFLEKSLSVSITASHNPAEYTGVIIYENGKTVRPNLVIEVKERKAKKLGEIKYEEINEEYKNYLLSNFGYLKDEKLKIIFDSLGGAATFIGNKIFQNICKTIPLRKDFDPHYFGLPPEPNEKTSEKLREEVIKERADLGIEVDADADRVLIVDETGNLINIARIEILFSKLLKYKKLVASISSPKIFEKYFEVIYTPVGRPYIENKIGKGLLGFEGSGHLYFGDFYPFSDGILAGIMLIKAIKKAKNKKLSELLKSIPNVFYFEGKIPVSSIKEAKKSLAVLEEKMKEYGKINKLDGVRLDINDSFILFRKSNTEPIIRYYVNSEKEENFEKMLQLAEKLRKII
ncbi:MAG: hypothetical protein QXV12_02045 [Candidatus Rehaiarchaeum fermentans]|nr:hypothetical protein [Candidatus Rehaiarchaeum fermentans]